MKQLQLFLENVRFVEILIAANWKLTFTCLLSKDKLKLANPYSKAMVLSQN